MTYDKWLDLKDKIAIKFQIEEYKKDVLENVADAICETLIFMGPTGKIKLEWISKAKILGEKTLYSGRLGADVKVEKIYSDSEKSEFLKAYQLKAGEWQEINIQNFSF